MLIRLFLVLALVLPVANAAWAGPAADQASQAGAPVTAPSGATEQTKPPPMRVEPARTHGQVAVEISGQSGKPSGFWGSGRPAVGGAYRYRLLGIGVAVVLLTLGIVVWILRRPAR